jgi:hypothetical protein
MAFKRFDKQTNIQVRGVSQSNEYDAAAEGLNAAADFFASQADQLFSRAAEDAQKEGKLQGENSIVINPDGTITRDPLPDAGRYFNESYLVAQRTAAASAANTSIRSQAQEFLVKHQNDPDAVSKFEEAFVPEFIQPIIDSAGADIKGEIAVKAKAISDGVRNQLSNIAIERDRKEQIAQVKTEIKSIISDIQQMHKGGFGGTEVADAAAVGLAAKLKAAIEGGLINKADVQAYAKSGHMAALGGDLMAKVKDKGHAAGMKIINDFLQKGAPGMDEEDLAQIASAARSVVVRDAQQVALYYEERGRAITEAFTSAEAELRELSLRDALTHDRKQEIIEKYRLDSYRDDPRGRRALWALQDYSSTQIERMDKEARAKTLAYDTGAYQDGKMSIWEFERRFNAGYYNADAATITHVGNVIRSNEARVIKAMEEDVHNDWMRIIHQNVEVGAYTEETLKLSARRDDEYGEWTMKNFGKIKTILADADTKLKGTGLEYRVSKAASDPGGKDWWNQFQAKTFNGKFDIQNTDHANAMGQVISSHMKAVGWRLPESLEDAFKNWRSHVSTLDGAKNISRLYDLARQSGVTGIAGFTDADHQELRASLARTSDPEEWKKIGNSYRDYSAQTLEWEKTLSSTKGIEEAQAAINSQFEKIAGDSSKMEAFAQALLGTGDTLRALGIERDTPEVGLEVLAEELKSFMSNGDLLTSANSPLSNEARNVLMNHFRSAFLRGDAGVGNFELSAELAIKNFGKSGGGYTMVDPRRPGELVLTHQSPELAAQKFGLPLEEMVRGHLMGIAGEVEKTLAGVGDLSSETLGGLLSKDNDVLNALVALTLPGVLSDPAGGINTIFKALSGKGQAGIFTGGDLGTTIREQISDPARFAQAFRENRILVRPFPGRDGAFQVGIRPNQNVTGRASAGIVWMNGEWEMDNQDKSAVLRPGFLTSIYNPTRPADDIVSQVRNTPVMNDIGIEE